MFPQGGVQGIPAPQPCIHRQLCFIFKTSVEYF
jgi:hypothetical protein